ncbi:MAG: UvrD-helicase domain-containing protein [Pseudomonadota bacterium]
MSEPQKISDQALAAMPRPGDDFGNSDIPSFLDGLNDQQREAVLATEGPVLMLAGAGTGKTKALTTRIAHILATRLAHPSQILAVTFTNKAAREMRERVRGLIGDRMEGMRWLGTFHSISAMILRRHAELVGLKSTFTIIDMDDQIRLCKQVIADAGLDEKRWAGRHFASVIDGWKNRGLTPDTTPKNEAYFFADGRAIELFKTYQDRLTTLNAADFGDLLVHTVSIFQKHPDILAEYQERFRYMLVDEYQDTNVAQYLWLRLIAQKTRNICCVGDDDQSIYGWRGAEVENILRFEKDFPGAKVIRLERNYRSTSSILAAASGLISANKSRLGKTLWTEDNEGEKVRVRGVWDGDEEARLIGDDIEAEQGRGRRLNDMAVLVRASFQMRSFEERFNALGLPYRVVGGPRFYEREETRDALSYFRLVRSPSDDLAFDRIANKPARKLGGQTMQTIHSFARNNGMSNMAAARELIATDDLSTMGRNALRRFVEMIDRWAREAENLPPRDLAELILEESGYTDYWRHSKSAKADSKLDNLKEVVQAVSEFDTMAAYLDHVALVAEHNETSPDGEVWLMTLHSAKGLEFPVVFLPGWEEEIFPSKRSVDENGEAGLEEERRLAYVGVTRAMEDCRISFAANRQVYGQWRAQMPSRFVDELPEDHVVVDSQPGLYGTSTEELASHSRFNGAREEPDTYYDNPGWRRARTAASRGDSQTNLIEGRATTISVSAPGEAKFDIGARVFHQKFGYGRVTAAEGQKLTVDFEHSGPKRVIDTFLNAG